MEVDPCTWPTTPRDFTLLIKHQKDLECKKIRLGLGHMNMPCVTQGPSLGAPSYRDPDVLPRVGRETHGLVLRDPTGPLKRDVVTPKPILSGKELSQP